MLVRGDREVAAIWTMGEIIVEIMRPRPDMPLDQVGEFVGPFPSGAPAIFADTVARLGWPAGIIGSVGNDYFGNCLLERLSEDGVDCRLVQRSEDRPTGVAFVSYSEDGSRSFLYHLGNSAAEVRMAPDVSGMEPPAFFHLMGCSLLASDRFRTEIMTVLRRFGDKGSKISFDPNIRRELLGDRDLASLIAPVMEYCSILLPGEEEIRLLSGVEPVERSVEVLFRRPALEVIVVKRGERGCSVFSRDTRVDLRAYDIRAVDPTGAGDAFDAGFLCGLLESKPFEECARIGSAAGALNAAAFGPMEGRITPERIAAVMAGEIN